LPVAFKVYGLAVSLVSKAGWEESDETIPKCMAAGRLTLAASAFGQSAKSTTIQMKGSVHLPYPLKVHPK